jgi:hypothetical protein
VSAFLYITATLFTLVVLTFGVIGFLCVAGIVIVIISIVIIVFLVITVALSRELCVDLSSGSVRCSVPFLCTGF